MFPDELKMVKLTTLSDDFCKVTTILKLANLRLIRSAGDRFSTGRQTWLPTGCEHQEGVVWSLRQLHQLHTGQLHGKQTETTAGAEKKVQSLT